LGIDSEDNVGQTVLMIYHRSNNRETPSWRLDSGSGSGSV